MVDAMRTLLVAQVIISFSMALLMTGYGTCLQLGFSAEWLQAWARSFVTAWPVAFCLSLVVGKLAFAIAHKVAPAGR